MKTGFGMEGSRDWLSYISHTSSVSFTLCCPDTPCRCPILAQCPRCELPQGPVLSADALSWGEGDTAFQDECEQWAVFVSTDAQPAGNTTTRKHRLKYTCASCTGNDQCGKQISGR